MNQNIEKCHMIPDSYVLSPNQISVSNEYDHTEKMK